MLTRQELKQDAWRKLSDKWGAAAGISALYIGIIVGIGIALYMIERNWMSDILENRVGLRLIYTAIMPVVIMPVIAVAGAGYEWICLKWSRNETAHLKMMFQPFRQFGKIFAVALLVYLMQLPFTLLQKLPGFCKADTVGMVILKLGPILMIVAAIVTFYIEITFILTPYIMHDRKELGVIETMKRSAAIMKGHKWDCFVLRFSFVLWCIAGTLLCGIGLLWVVPYISTTMANFYNELLLQEQQQTEAAMPGEMI